MSSISVYRRYAQPDWYYRQASAKPPVGQPSRQQPPRRTPEPRHTSEPQSNSAPGHPPEPQRPPEPRRKPEGHASQERQGRQAQQSREAPASRDRPFRRGLDAILPEGVDGGDLFLAAILLFLYSESRDEDFLIILIVVCISIFQSKNTKTPKRED